MVANFTSLPFYAKQFDDPGEQWFADVIKATKNGNDKNRRNELSNCTYFFENQKWGHLNQWAMAAWWLSPAFLRRFVTNESLPDI
jgi:hypothetical protein